jgi:hypothetical protein
MACLSGVEGQFAGMMGGHGMMGGYGMGSGLIAVPDRLPAPNNTEWIQNLREVLSRENKSYIQYTTDEKKYNVGMPYTMVVPQEVNHISSIEKLFSAYGLGSDGKPENPTETTNLKEAYQLGIQMEQDLISRYSWLVQNAVDRDTAQILNDISIQSRWHLQMFQNALNMGGYGMGGMMGGYWRMQGYGY